MSIKLHQVLGFVLFSAAMVVGGVSNSIGNASLDYSTTISFNRGFDPVLGYKTQLDKVVEHAKSNDDFWIVLQSHTGTRGSDDANFAKSEKRIERITRELSISGISTSRIIGQPMGEAHTLGQEPHETDNQWQKRLNRMNIIVTLRENHK